MDERLKYSAELLLAQADQAVDRRNNGLWDREDCIVLIDEFRSLLRDLLKDQDRLESDRGDLTRRLQRTYFLRDDAVVAPAGSDHT
jgi:hypothetical protein